MRNTKLFSIAIFLTIALVFLAACGGAKTATPDPNAAKPSNTGGTGEALALTGNAQNGEKIFASTCVQCHGDQGKGGVRNEGAVEDVPGLNPIDETMTNTDPKVFAANLDLFLEHGSTPEGESPSKIMMAFGDQKLLKPQEIADLIAYVISLNPK